MSKLIPCPFCKGGKTVIDEQKYWTGMRYNTLSYVLKHWCDSESFNKTSIQMRAKTQEEIEDLWNKR